MRFVAENGRGVPDQSQPHGGRERRRLILLGSTALAAFVAFGLLDGWESPVALAHLVLAVGVFPLIIAMMIHFTAVLTRTAPAEGWIARIPWLATAAGVTLVLALMGGMGELTPPLIVLAAFLGLGTARLLLAWMNQRAAACLGDPHPGLAWYRAALWFLTAGLFAILGAFALPMGSFGALRSFHLHVNLMGFVGVTAIGTLQVLLPTVGRYADPEVNRRLRGDLKFAVAGTLLAGLGAAWWHLLSALGLIAWMIPLVRLARSCASELMFSSGGAAPTDSPGAGAGVPGGASGATDGGPAPSNGAAISLLGALLGFALVLLAGIPIGLGWMDPSASVALFFAIFLFPLVTGALGHFLPLWLRPGDVERQERLRHLLGRWAAGRILIFFSAGGALAAGESWGTLLATVGLLLFAGQALLAARAP